MIAVWSLLLVPVSVLLAYVVDAGPALSFAVAVLAIVPLAEWIRRATEQLARVVGPAVGGLLNVTFGNAAELVLAVFVLLAGHPDVVKAQITGSIVGNGLLGLGIAILVGSRGRAIQRFGRARAGLLSSLLVLSLIGLLVPAVFAHTERAALESVRAQALIERLSLGVAAVLVLVYAANLVYTLRTSRDVFGDERKAGGDGSPDVDATGIDASGNEAAANEAAGNEAAGTGGAGHASPAEDAGPRWTAARSTAVLVAATVVTAFEAEIVSSALEATADSLGVTTFFLGITVLAIIGNASEYVSAAFFASRGRMGLVLSITVGSSIQVALLVAPLLVLLSWALGTPMDLVFRPLELAAIAATAFAVNAIAQDGESNWFEGVLLVSAWTILAVAFFFASP